MTKAAPTDQAEIDRLAKIIWDYLKLDQPPKPADCILVSCSHDSRVAEYATDLFLRGYAPYLLLSGGLGKVTEGTFQEPEANVFAEIAIARDVPAEKILIENKSANTGENVEFSRQLITKLGLKFGSFILVQKPYMERRGYATFKRFWPGPELTVTSPPISFENCPNSIVPKEELINIMVGDLQRIKVYPEKGFQIAQDIPPAVWDAYERLVDLGYTKHLVR